jgi:hypothetical protein
VPSSAQAVPHSLSSVDSPGVFPMHNTRSWKPQAVYTASLPGICSGWCG